MTDQPYKPRPATVAEKAEDLTPTQRAMVDRLKFAYLTKTQVTETVVRLMEECWQAGISTGVMGHELGVSRQAVHQLLQSRGVEAPREVGGKRDEAGTG